MSRDKHMKRLNLWIPCSTVKRLQDAATRAGVDLTTMIRLRLDGRDIVEVHR